MCMFIYMMIYNIQVNMCVCEYPCAYVYVYKKINQQAYIVQGVLNFPEPYKTIGETEFFG